LGFDPLDLKPLDPEELREVQNIELTHGRWAMLGMAVMVLQELATGSKLDLGF
jgi:light-harvesting complex I chlorophyll a/b binding protein 1